MKKIDAFSFVIYSTRNGILRRLMEGGKAAYSDLLDSVDRKQRFSSTGNFNYHLNILLRDAVIIKEGARYRLTDKGWELARFVQEVDKIWSKLESKLVSSRF